MRLSVGSSMLVRTVMPSVAGRSRPVWAHTRSTPRCAACIMATPPEACIVSMSAPLATADAAAPST